MGWDAWAAALWAHVVRKWHCSTGDEVQHEWCGEEGQHSTTLAGLEQAVWQPSLSTFMSLTGPGQDGAVRSKHGNESHLFPVGPCRNHSRGGHESTMPFFSVGVVCVAQVPGFTKGSCCAVLFILSMSWSR